MACDAGGERVLLAERIARALFDRDRHAVGEPMTWDECDDGLMKHHWRVMADAVVETLQLSRQERTHWTLYNPREKAHRMTVVKGDGGVWDIGGARLRMAPYHQEGDGYEVVERTQVWWSTPTEMTTDLPTEAEQMDRTEGSTDG